jgi:Flp pilus assembly pilin Flp
MRVLLAMLLDDAGNAIVEYAIVAAAVALPLIGIGYAIANNTGIKLGSTTQGLSNLGITPP